MRASTERTKLRRRGKAISVSFGAALALLVMAGCGDDSGPAAILAPGTSADGLIGIDPGLGKLMQIVPVPVTGEVPEQTVHVSAVLGGVVHTGRHTLVIPPLALARDTDITLRDLSGVDGRVEVEALPEGLTFRLPVTLTSQFGEITSPASFTMYWVRNPGTPIERWEPMPTVTTLTGITAELRHFCRYSPGKAGW